MVGKIPWRRKWRPTPVFLPGESHGQRSLAGYGPWDGKESDTTETKTTTAALKGKLGTCNIKRLVHSFRTIAFSCVDFRVTSVCQAREFSVILCQGWGFCALTVTSTVPVHAVVPRHTQWVPSYHLRGSHFRISTKMPLINVPCFTNCSLNIHLELLHGTEYNSGGKESACNMGDRDSIPGWGRSPEEGKGYPLQYSGLENSTDYI